MKNYMLAVLVLVAALASGVRADEPTPAPSPSPSPALVSTSTNGTMPIAPKPPETAPMLSAEFDALLALEERKARIATEAASIREVKARLVPDLQHRVWVVTPTPNN